MNRTLSTTAGLSLWTLLSGTAAAQALPDAYVTDVGKDEIFLLSDLNSDGDYNDAAEIAFWRGGPGVFTGLDLALGIEPVFNDEFIYCEESQLRRIFDANLDMDANDSGEVELYMEAFSSGVTMAGAQDLHWDESSQTLYVATTGGSFLDDAIITVRDLNMDGDARDLGEGKAFWRPAPGSALTDSLLQDVAIGLDGAVYALDSGLSGAIDKGVYRLEDLDLSGSIDQPNEVTPFYTPADLQTGFPTSLTLGPDGFWYLTDRNLDQVRRFADLDASGDIQSGTEDSVWFTSTVGTSFWEILPDGLGGFLVLDGQAPSHIYRLRDTNNDGAVDPVTEASIVMDGSLVPGMFSTPRGFAVPVSGVPEFRETCSSDGLAAPGCGVCPCGNEAPMGTVGGCLNSAGTSTRLLPSGVPSILNDSMHFDASGAPPSAFCILNSGDNVAPIGMANPCFGTETGILSVSFDGMRCAVGNTLRHGGRSADLSGDVGLTNNGWGPPNNPTIGFAAQVGFVVGQTRHFQIIHRDDQFAVCMRGLNTSQAVEVTYLP